MKISRWLPRVIAVALAGLWFGSAGVGWGQIVPMRDQAAAAEAARGSRVVIARDPRALRYYELQPDRVIRMVERAMLALTDQSTVASAWRQFVKPDDVVGIKINTVPGTLMGTHRVLVEAVVAGLKQAGVPAGNIIIWDRSKDDMTAAGWKLHPKGDGPLYLATIPDEGWDESVYYTVPRVGTIIWGDFEFGERQVSERSYYSRIVTERVTKLINIPVLTDNRHVGISGCLHNIAVGSVDNNRRFQTENLHYDAGIAEICARPPISRKLVLNILDSLVGQYAGGPSFDAEMSWKPGELYFSRDPVALDALGLEELEKQRKAAGIIPIGDLARHVHIADELHIGTDQRSKMEIIELAP